jgi:hypothetical protein
VGDNRDFHGIEDFYHRLTDDSNIRAKAARDVLASLENTYSR